MPELLTQPTKYNIEDSNIALLGSDLEKNVREHAGDKELAWNDAGKQPGTQIWRIEKFHIVEWPKIKYGVFYDGDSYIILYTYKKTPDAQDLSYDLHFWIGSESSQDEAATAAYKTVELDDHLDGVPVQYREVQGYESQRFLSYFPKFICQRGGVATGFHHVSSTPPANTKRLYRIIASGTHIIVREVPPDGSNFVPGDAYVLDKGVEIWQFNTKSSVGKERYKAAEFIQMLAGERQLATDVSVFDEGALGAGTFLAEIGLDGMPSYSTSFLIPSRPRALFRLSDATGEVIFTRIEELTRSSLSSYDAFLLDDASNTTAPAIYVWIGNEASLNERRLAIQYAQAYLYQNRKEGGRAQFSIPIVRLKEGRETDLFLQAVDQLP
ncbi:fragmin60 [Abortiporus biennis]|nr:fragmin60 [Abortiporus biennis]